MRKLIALNKQPYANVLEPSCVLTQSQHVGWLLPSERCEVAEKENKINGGRLCRIEETVFKCIRDVFVTHRLIPLSTSELLHQVRNAKQSGLCPCLCGF